MLPQPRRRWAFFPRSVISDHQNPAAHLYRAMARRVGELDDEARFYEERANPWLRSMLLEHGAESFRSFQQRHPEVSYVTYEPRHGHRLAEWLSLALATVDIVVVDSEAPPIIVQWIGELTRPQLQTFLLDPDGNFTEQDDIPDYARYYRGLCTSHPGAESIFGDRVQELITFGPALPAPGQNGKATRHIEQTAQELVDQLARLVDESIINQQNEPPPGH